jgi:hypothetical protein
MGFAVVVVVIGVAAAAAIVEIAPQLGLFLCLFMVRGSNFHAVCLFVCLVCCFS